MNGTLTGISSMATRLVLDELARAYERESGWQVRIESVGGVDAARRVEGGEAFDVVVLASDAIDRLVRSGRVAEASKTALFRSGVAVAVRAGAPRPDLGSEAALKRAVLAARTIGYSTGPSGVHLAKLFERWGIAEQVASRIVQPPPGVPVGTLIARGDIELGFQQLSELMNVPGIDVAGLLPPQVQITTVFSGAVCTASAQADSARRLLAFLASPARGDAKRRHGMEGADSPTMSR
ncbi:MAG TPA: substrate-binding domain-containing protein [Casimicrobiaceae bacterium]|nr:substrate-binding domain-containing protein [Casimicrobiaceae bacterium]